MDENEEKLDEALDGVIVKHRADQAYEMLLRGLSLGEIAQEMGYSTPVEVNRAIKERYAVEARDLSAEERQGILALEVARLNKLQSAVWESAMYGEPKAVDSALKIIALRSKLLGLDQPEAQTNQNTVLVVGGAEADYIEQLKRMTEPKELSGGGS